MVPHGPPELTQQLSGVRRLVDCLTAPRALLHRGRLAIGFAPIPLTGPYDLAKPRQVRQRNSACEPRVRPHYSMAGQQFHSRKNVKSTNFVCVSIQQANQRNETPFLRNRLNAPAPAPCPCFLHATKQNRNDQFVVQS